MYSLNRAEIIGNLTRDPEVRTTTSNQTVCSFAVATNRRWKDKDGNLKEDTQYHEVSLWGRLAEFASQSLSKGKKVYVEGRLQTSSWEGNDGVKRTKTEIVAENFIPLSPRDGGPSFEIASSPDSESGASKKKSKTDEKSQADEINLDDIPF